MRMETRSIYKSISYLLVFSMLFWLPITAASAKTVTYVKEYTYQASEVDSKLSCRTIALEQVKRLLLEELGTYLISETAVKDFQLTSDRISSLTAGIVMTVILEENWDGKTYFLKAKITTDTDELVKSIDRIRGDQEQSKNWEEVMKKTEEALKEIEKLKKEIGSGRGEKVSQEKYVKAVNELNAMDWFNKGYVLKNSEKKNQDAIKAFDKAIEIDPNYAKAYAGRAAIYNDWRQFQQALRESEQAIKLDPNLPWGFNCRGVAHTGMLNYQEAIQDFNKATKLDPLFSWSFLHRGYAFLKLDKTEQALADFKRAANLGNGEAQRYLKGKGIQW